GAGADADRRWVHGAGGAKFSPVAFGFPALSGCQTTILLDHDLVSVRTGRAHGGWHFLSRPGLVLGVALEELTLQSSHNLRNHPCGRRCSANRCVRLAWSACCY